MDATPEREIFQRKLVAALSRSPPAPWYEIWGLCLTDPWFQGELVKQARFVLRSQREPMEWLDDVCQATILILSAKLKKSPNLDMAIGGPEDDVSNFLRKTLRNASRQVLKRLRRIYSTGVELSDDIDLWAASAGYDHDERLRAVNAAINELPEPFCTILQLHLLDYTLTEISSSLGISYWDAYRDFHQGMELLRAELGLP